LDVDGDGDGDDADADDGGAQWRTRCPLMAAATPPPPHHRPHFADFFPFLVRLRAAHVRK